MENLIVTTPENLTRLIREAVREASNNAIPKATPLPDKLEIKAAVEFLNSEGYPISLSSLRRLVFEEQIPYRKFGSRVIFNTKDLRAWAEVRTVSKKKQISTSELSKSARRQSSKK